MISERRVTNSRVVLAVLAIGAAIVALVWIRAALLMAHCGFDLTDEGYYILSYRWWNVNHRTYTGVQYLYGPVFQAFGWDIAKLRVFRIATIVGADALFGIAFMRWLRLRRPNAPKSLLWETIGTALIVAAGGMQCSWFPLSPGYNDVILVGGLLATAGALRIAALVEERRRIQPWLAAAFGPVVLSMALAKWASAVTVLGPTMFVIAAVVAARGWRDVAKTFAWMVAGTVLFALVLELFIVRLDRAIPQILEVNRLLVKTNNSPSTLLTLYWDTTTALVERTRDQHELLFIAAAVAVAARGRAGHAVAAVIAYVAIGRSLTRLESGHALLGGANNIANYPVTIAMIALTALVMIVVAFGSAIVTYLKRTKQPSFVKDSPRGWLVLALVALFPISHGFGTGNAIAFMIVAGFAAWMAVLIAVATGFDGESLAARWFGYALVACSALAAVLITKSAFLEALYRTYPYEASTEIAAGVPSLHGIRQRPDVAQRWSALHAALAPYIEPKGRAMMAFDELSGIVFLLDARPVGEAWYSSLDHERTAEGIRATCRAPGGPWWGSRRPIVLSKRGISATETRALAECGIDFNVQYKQLPQTPALMGYQVWVPADGL